MENSIGIDFGTTKTMASFLNLATGRVEMIRLGRDRDSIPTTVHVDESGAFLFGEDADDMIEIDPEGYVRAFKVELGSKEPIAREGQTAEMLTTRFLAHVKDECEKTVFHDSVATATITIPVSFSPARRAALERAATTAGFSDVTFLPEPEAAGTAFLRDNPSESFSRALILDWGGGTLDISILTKDEDGRIHADGHCSEGRDDVGGEVMDLGLLGNIAAYWETTNGETLMRDETDEVRFRRAAQKIKEQLSKKDSAIFRRGPKKLDITREQFNQTIVQLLDAAVELVASALSKNKENGNPDPDALILIGGSCQIPAVRDKMEQNFPKLRVLSWHHSHEAVALGATSIVAQDPPKDFLKNEKRHSIEPNAETTDNLFATTEKDAKVLKDVLKFVENSDITPIPFEKADAISVMAREGNPRAMGLLGWIYLDGCVDWPANYERAAWWWNKAAEMEDEWGMTGLIMHYCNQEKLGGNNPELALSWALRCLKKYPSPKNYSLIVLALDSFPHPDANRINETIEQISELVGTNKPSSFTVADRASIGGAFAIAGMQAFVAQDGTHARKLFEKAVAFEDPKFKELLEELPDVKSGRHLDAPPISILCRGGVLSGQVLKITNLSDRIFKIHYVSSCSGGDPTVIKYDFTLNPNETQELGWLELPRNLMIGEQGMLRCEGYYPVVFFLIAAHATVSTLSDKPSSIDAMAQMLRILNSGN